MAENDLMERAQPGTGAPPAITYPTPERDAAEGWRRDTVPASFETTGVIDPYVTEVLEQVIP